MSAVILRTVFLKKNHMKSLIIIILLLNSLCSFGQEYAINSKFLKSGTLKIDSIAVQISAFEDRIETESYFEKSKSTLSVIYIKIGNSYTDIVAREDNPIYDDCYRVNQFDFENEKLSNGEERFYLTQKLKGKSENFLKVKESFNKALSSEFLAKYVVELYDKTENYR
jgi:hypothetical protein